MIFHQSDIGLAIGQEIINPSISIILPFEPKMTAPTVLQSDLILAREAAVKCMATRFEHEMVAVLDEKIGQAVDKLNYDTHKKSVALFISTILEKIFYLDFPVEEKIIVNESFEIRDLVYAKKELHKYLVVVAGERCCKVFIGNTNTFIRIKSTVPEHTGGSYQERSLEAFIRQADAELTTLRQTFPLPIFVLGSQRVTDYFRSITTNRSTIISYIQGNFEDASEHVLRIALTPFIADWKQLKMTELFQQINHAALGGAICSGIQDVHRKLVSGKGRKLIVEKNFMHPAATEINTHDETRATARSAYIHDLVDELIERTLAAGGDVEFVEEGSLKDFGQIVLIV